MQPLTRKQSRAIDKLAINQLAIPGPVLMENAGRSAVQAILPWLAQRRIGLSKARVAIICGSGNNGGDGYVIARHLHNRAVNVEIFATKHPDKLTGDAKVHATITQRIALPLTVIKTGNEPATFKPNVIIDALLGTGYQGQMRPLAARIIDCCNQLRQTGAATVAIDLPSGLDCDTGQPATPTIEADLTITFVAPKVGFATEQAKRHLGRLVIADIGTPPSLLDRI